jgi:tetratricopeptide (TPR) repeat protein
VHATVARAFEELHRDKLDERAALLAYHWEHAGEARRAAEWHRRAADWIGNRDRAEMLRHWRKVRTLLATVRESPETLSLGVQACRNIIHSSNTLGIWDDEMPAVFAEGRALAERLGDPAVLVRLLNSYGVAMLAMGAGREALAHLRESLRVADESGRPFLRFIARLPLATLLRSAGSLREALALNEEADALVEGSPELDAEIGASPYAFLLTDRASIPPCRSGYAPAADFRLRICSPTSSPRPWGRSWPRGCSI